MTGAYRLVRSVTTAAEFHHRTVPEPAPFELWWPDITAPALVLGSSQPDADVDQDACERAGIEVVRRRSGGGAVLLVPNAVTWLDVIVPAGSAGWSDDVYGPMVWLGHQLAVVLASLLDGSPERSGEITVHEGRLVTTPWSALVCFDGVGAGEVLLGGRKLVGISQRRTREAARLQCCWYSDYDAAVLVELLAPGHRPMPTELRPVATVPRAIADAIPEALAARLG